MHTNIHIIIAVQVEILKSQCPGSFTIQSEGSRKYSR